MQKIEIFNRNLVAVASLHGRSRAFNVEVELLLLLCSMLLLAHKIKFSVLVARE